MRLVQRSTTRKYGRYDSFKLETSAGRAAVRNNSKFYVGYFAINFA